MTNQLFEINVNEPSGIPREKEPVTFGVPFPKGLVSDLLELAVEDSEHGRIPVAMTPIARWTDRSIKWMLFDLQLSMPANGKKCLRVRHSSTSKDKTNNVSIAIKINRPQNRIYINTGKVEFKLDFSKLFPFTQIVVNGKFQLVENKSSILLIDDKNEIWTPRVEKWSVELKNPLRVLLLFKGSFVAKDAIHILRYLCRIHFYAEKEIIRIDFNIWNPCAAHHPGGVWDMGDPGSIFFKDLSFNFFTKYNPKISKVIYKLTNEPSAMSYQLNCCNNNLLIFQNSSGGENWRSHNHINRHSKTPVSFRGFEVREGTRVISRGMRATPFLALSNGKNFIAGAVKNFWQNFPKAIESSHGNLRVSLFPKHFNYMFELQGGQQKTHTCYIMAGSEPIKMSSLDWIHKPLMPQISPEWYNNSGACHRLSPLKNNNKDAYFSAYQQMVDVAICGDQSFFNRREIIDEYGWQNFGDIYADHEAVFHKGKEEFVSHYNNQYDVIKGAIIQFMRTAESVWFRLADELASHVSDIDIYHTNKDRYQYNNGLFWHTDHHLDAATCTHRSASGKHREFKDPRSVGSGPSLAHLYTTGFLYHYWLTGDSRSKEAVIDLAEYAIRGFEGPDTVVETAAVLVKKMLKWGKQKIKPLLVSYDEYYQLNGPGRTSGNTLNALLDGYLINADNKYMEWAERLIINCLSPEDNIDEMNLLEAESRWMYTIFLQALGKYLDIKVQIDQIDSSFWYARAALIKYAQWMLRNEYSYLENPKILQFPNETWAAQEIRKSDILSHAAYYAPRQFRQELLKKSRFFFEACIDQLRAFETRELTRPIVLLMTNGMVHMDLFSKLSYSEEIASKHIDYALTDLNAEIKQNRVLDQIKRFLEVAKNTSLTKECQWTRQRLQQMNIKSQ